MELGIKGRVAIVTGGGRGIGAGIAESLLAEGADVTVWDLAFDNQTTSTGSARHAQRHVDVTDYPAVLHAANEVYTKKGRVDILINNAGINGKVGSVEDYDIAEWERVLKIDLTSVFYCTKAIVPLMKANGYGRIVNIASMAAKEGNAGIAAYASAKAGVVALTKSVARELASDNILVNAIAPALTETELFAQMTPEHIAAGKAKIPMNRCVQISEVAEMTVWAASE
jgi:NAD(P)-dependent dehydrogenase (short-subunit alcohol dehydrogenase family)